MSATLFKGNEGGSCVDAAQPSRLASHLPSCAIVLGAGGRVGGAFTRRLRRDGWAVIEDPADPVTAARSAASGSGAWLFDCAYRDGDPAAHVERVGAHLAHWRDYAGIFVPSSDWIDQDEPYGFAKRAVEALAAFYRSLGANVITDRIGYFPGDGKQADPLEPMIDRLVDGETLYARVMAALRTSAIVDSTEAASSGRQISRSGSSGSAQL